VFLCARSRVSLARAPQFQPAAAAPFPRQLPPASVFQATESRFSDDFAQLALKITSPFGLTGWITVSFCETLEEVDDPRAALPQPVLVQNIAPRTGKWMGELPVRGAPTLQAPRRGTLESFRVATAVERKLVKDHVWLRLQDFEGAQGNDDGESNQEEEEAWIIERHANTAERVTVPWGADQIHDQVLHRDEYAERYYRNIYGRRVLPLRQAPRLESDVVGELAPGSVVISTRRVLNERGQVWIRIAMTDATTVNTQDVTYGYAIQSSAKTNVCMLQEITAPGKMTPKQFFQVVLKPATAPSNGQSSDTMHRLAARSEPSRTATELFYLKNGAVVSAIGSIYNSEQKTMWLQVLREDLDPDVIEKKALLPHEQREQDDNQKEDDTQDQYVVYVPVCYTEDDRGHECALFALGRTLQKAADPEHEEAERQRTGARVVFTGGRASKLFGSQLMRPSTIDMDAKPKTLSNTRVASAAGEEDPTQSLKEEIDAWQRESGDSGFYAYAQRAKTSLFSCVQRPFSSCLQRNGAQRMYAQLHQDDAEEEV
jgi:hypothetical protein